MIDPAHTQTGHRLRLEWGPTGAAALAAHTDVAVVVDVLSFTTTVSVAVSRGMEVHPYPWRDDRAAQYAADRDATLAVGRLEALAGPGTPSLSPASLVNASGIERLVLPSPNGSTISAALASGGATVVAASLRNAGAVREWLRSRLEACATAVVVPAGERWPDDTLRPCTEDLWGAGAVLAGLDERLMSPEARLAATAYRVVVDALDEALASCASGVELAANGFATDVAVAAEVDADDAVPVLAEGAFRPSP